MANSLVYMMVGNIGTGKSTTSKLLIDDKTVHIGEDLLAPTLFDGRYDQGVWTQAHFRIYRKLKMAAIEAALGNGFDIILDGTNIAEANRAKYLEIAKAYSATVICYVFPDFEVGLKNRLRNHRGTPGDVWKEVSAKLQRQFEMPTRGEGIHKIIEVRTEPAVNKWKDNPIDGDGDGLENR